MATAYVPNEGDIIWLSFTPQSGHEQAGRRPAVVLSPKMYNSRSGLLVCVPVTNQIKGYPFEVALKGSEATGVALADQVNSLDWQSRQPERKGTASSEELAEIKAKIRALLSLS
ncbi:MULTISPECIES: endoribonuclease MazF [Thiorhodovibrio]|uniref:endoribonuclease MazF n=1 Tax=Thiorhodovibrio TaxID=61593 RepID=UPI001912F3A6|nr:MULTISPECIES: endoribonuclease MazF [Thiorhodovibrio]MBK5970358.1 toxin MazF [Thiorhodovibrio winogradskyi]WPL10421.1 mRNA interferase MazF [Thiorhodovibrio litoralis]